MTDSTNQINEVASEKFLARFFEKLTDKDFLSDRVLAAFYISYKDYLKKLAEDDEKNGKVSIPSTLFQYYTEYLLRNKDLNELKKKEEIKNIFDNIKTSILNPHIEEKEDINPRLGRKEENPPIPGKDQSAAANKQPTKEKRVIKKIIKKDGTVIKKIIKRKVAVDTTSTNNTSTNTNTNTSNATTTNNTSVISNTSTNNTSVTSNANNTNTTKVKLNKKHALGVICESLKQSYIITYETPDIDVTQEDEEFRDNTTSVIKQEIIDTLGCLPAAHKDVAFNRRNDMIELWRRCEVKLMKFLEEESLSSVLKKIFFIDSKEINTSKKSVQTINMKEIEKQLPQETILSRYVPETYNTIISVVQNDVLGEAVNRIKQGNKKFVVLLDEMQFIPGGDSDQGRESRITPVYYSSTYSLCLENVANAYPLDNTQLFYIPNILVFKNHKLPLYPMRPPTEVIKLSAIGSAPRYRPETNIKDQDKYKMDERLYLPNALYKKPEQVVQQLTGIFNTALFFGFNTIILDDLGVEDNWSPVIHTALIMASVINQFRGKFKEIVVAVNDQHLFTTFRKYIN